jgi:hypothetical protein
MEKIFKELDVVVKDDYTSLSFAIPYQKVESLVKK